jgi:hypothetical protein
MSQRWREVPFPAFKYYALSVIEPATSWIELHPLPNLTSATTCTMFDN